MSTTASLTLPPALLFPAWAEKSAGTPTSPGAMPTLSDRTLIERVARGDADAFTTLYRRYERPVFGVLLRLAGRRAVAEEWLQETFTRVWLAAATHDPSRGEVRPWLFKIAVNTARSEMARKRYRTPHLSLDETGLELTGDDAGEITARLDAARRENELARALQALPDFMREVIVLRCSRELTFAEISRVTGAPEGTLKSRFHRAVAALREALSPGKERRG